MKIGDLTLRETKIICKKYKCCLNCPLFPKEEFCCLLNSSHFEENYLDQEVEIEVEKTDKEIAFDLIDTKNVDIKLLKWAYPSVEAYNVKVRTEKDYWWREELTKEEFDFLGRMVGAE